MKHVRVSRAARRSATFIDSGSAGHFSACRRQRDSRRAAPSRCEPASSNHCLSRILLGATPDNLGDEVTARLHVVSERLDAGAHLIASAGGGPDGIGAGRPHVRARDFIPVAMDQPMEGPHTSVGRQRGVLLREITSRARQCRGSQGVCFASAIASSNSFAFFAAANHLPSSPGVNRTRSARIVAAGLCGYFLAIARNQAT